MRSGKDVGYGVFIPLGWADAASAGGQAWGVLSAAARNRKGRGCGTKTGADARRHFRGLRHTPSECAAKHAMKAAWNRQLGRVKQVCLLSLSEEELCGREPFHEMHEAMAARALP